MQLVGLTALFIASKFEEVAPPEVTDFVYIAADAYTKEDLIEMEIRILSALEFRVAIPTAAHFLERVMRVSRASELQQHFSKFLLELSLTEYSMVKYLPSHLASAALLLANRLLQLSTAWPAVVEQDMELSEDALEACVEELRELWVAKEPSQLQAVRKKSRHARYRAISEMVLADVCIDDAGEDTPVASSRAQGPLA